MGKQRGPNRFFYTLSRIGAMVAQDPFKVITGVRFSYATPFQYASIAQLDRALHYGCKGWGFESL